jgi:drug/metabolite transporter (DMT)-like permease
MRPSDYARLVALAAIWGASFMFMRMAAPALGPVWTAEGRVLLGGIALLLWFRVTGFDPSLRRHGRFYLLVGTVNSAIPFTLYAFAAQHAAASLLAVLNATAPMFGMAFGAMFAGERISGRKVLGLVLGAAGVAIIARPDSAAAGPMFGWAVAAALAACCCYGITGVLIKRFARGAPPRGIAAGNQLGAALVLAPLLPLATPAAAPGALVVVNLLALALLASAVAFVLYFRLIAEVGATRALTVTYLIPVFGILWGRLFLDESLVPGMLAGAASIVAGTVLVTRS